MITLALILLAISLLILLWEFSTWSWDDIDLWLKIASVVLTAFTVAVGAVAIISGYYLGKRQAQEILTQQKNIEILKGNNLELQSTVEQERITRLQLEESLEPRILAHNGIVRDRLKALAGTPFIIEVVEDGEAVRAANQILSLLKSSGWNELGAIKTNSAPEGVRIETIVLNKTIDIQPTSSAEILVEFLEANGWEVRNGFNSSSLSGILDQTGNSGNIPNGTVRIRVGNKPTIYFMEKFISNEQTRKVLEELRSETKARRERLREEWGLPPRLP